MKSSLPKNQGFTLIELIVVIVILGIMAAIAGPKFVNLQSDARISVIKGVEGSLRSAATLVYAKALIAGIEQDAAAGANVVLVNGTAVTLHYGYPTADDAGIGAVIDLSGDITTANDGVFTLRANCIVTYLAASGAAGPPFVSTPPSITPTVTGC